MNPIDALTSFGMSPVNAEIKRRLYAACDEALDAIRAQGTRRTAWVPGRIEVLGKHTDYAGGRSVVCAVERGFAVRWCPRRDSVVRIIDVARRQQCETRLDRAVEGRRGEWSNYIATVARRLARDFPAARTGADIVLASDLPSAAGLSSSSALVVAVSLALIDANALRESPAFAERIHSNPELGGYLGALENGLAFGSLGTDAGVGTFGGSEDHVAVLCSIPGHVSQYSYAPVRHEGDIRLSDGFTWVIGASGVTANKAGDARENYNRLSLATSWLLARWNDETGRRDPTLAAALDSSDDAYNALRTLAEFAHNAPYSAHFLRDRLDQFRAESSEIVPAATAAIERGAMDELGALVDRSQALAESHLGNQIPETIMLQRLAREHGALASSAFGAGFGGSVWSLVPTATARDFAMRWTAAYASAHPKAARRATFFVSPCGPSARLW